jgi:endoglycosylceramidase
VSRDADPACPKQEKIVFTQQALAAHRNSSALLLTEFGASDELGDIGRVAALADKNLVSWTYWHYGSWSDPTGNPGAEGMFQGDLSRPATLKQPKADVLIRAYPQAIAGTPGSFSYNTATGAFSLTYFADPANTSGPTEIFVPVGRPNFGAHYVVSVTGPGTVTSAADAPLLTIAGTGRGTVTVRVTKG